MITQLEEKFLNFMPLRFLPSLIHNKWNHRLIQNGVAGTCAASCGWGLTTLSWMPICDFGWHWVIAVFTPHGNLRLRKIPARLLARGPLASARFTFGSWIALALEFQLGADVVQTTVSRETSALIQLAAVAIVRTFLNYFLSLELKEKTHTD